MEDGVEKEEGVGEEKEEGMEGSALHTGITITFTSPTARPQQSVDAGRAKATAPTVATPTVVVRNACLVCVALRAKVFLISALVVVWCVVCGVWCGMCSVCTNVRWGWCCWDYFSIVYGQYGVCVCVCATVFTGHPFHVQAPGYAGVVVREGKNPVPTDVQERARASGVVTNPGNRGASCDCIGSGSSRSSQALCQPGMCAEKQAGHVLVGSCWSHGSYRGPRILHRGRQQAVRGM